MNKYFSFLKNALIEAAVSVPSGVAGAYVAKFLSYSPSVISVTSTMAQYAASIPTFSILQARDNQDLYENKSGEFKWKVFMTDMGKLNTACLLLDALYLTSRPVVNSYFQSKGYDPMTASLYSDSVCIPVHLTGKLILGWLLGVIREENKTE